MTVFDRAFKVAAETHDSGALLNHEPYPLPGDVPWEIPARWRVGTGTWDELRGEAKRANGMVIPTKATGTQLLGYPLVVDESADPDLMVLERQPIRIEAPAD